ncbi:hypothetical protein EHEC06054_51070 [Escherichia coli]
MFIDSEKRLKQLSDEAKKKHRGSRRSKEEFKVYTGIPKRLGTRSRAAEG